MTKAAGASHTHGFQFRPSERPDMTKPRCSKEGCDRRVNSRGYCKKHYEQLRLAGTWFVPGSQRTPSPAGAPEAFIQYAVKYTGTECLLWPYGKIRGYGAIRGGTHSYAHAEVMHRVAGPKPTGPGLWEACHAPVVCHNRACVNPAHLRWDTRKANMADARLDGNPQGPLTADQVRAIRASTDLGYEIAEQFGIGQHTVSRIRNHLTYKWVK